MNYNEIKSDYIKNLMYNSSWQDHTRIDDLIKLHKYILVPPRNWSGGMAFTHLKTMYRAEYLDLLSEHSPAALEKVLSEERAIIDKRIKMQSESDAIYEQQKTSWLLAGGKL